MKTYQQIYLKAQKELLDKYQLPNIHQVPKISKVTVAIGIGQAQTNPKFAEACEKSLMLISGQKPIYTLSKKAISGFKLQKGLKIGLKTTLRGKRMQDFIIRLIDIVIPRFRDFRGLDVNKFDKNGNYNLGIQEQIVFPEIRFEEVDVNHGLQINITTTTKNYQLSKDLLVLMGFPFKKDK